MITAGGGDARFLAADLREEAACTSLVAAAADALDGLTVLVNNAAGGDDDAPVGRLTTKAWEAILRVDLTAPFWLCRAALPHLERAGGGAIVNISSRQAERASPGFAAYIAAKGGLNALTRSIAVDYAAVRHPLQHDQPGLRAQRPARRRHRRRTPEPLRRHAPDPARAGGRCRARRGVPREHGVGVRHRRSICNSTAAAASPGPRSCSAAISL